MSWATAAPATADENVPLNAGECKFNTNNIEETPWSLQRILTNQLWEYGQGEGVRVGVIDTGVDVDNKQLSGAIGKGGGTLVGGKPTQDEVGHGTKVAGIIAARKIPGSGFFGLAPAAKIVPYKQTTEEKAGTAESLAKAINKAVAADVKILNISQGTDADPSKLGPLKASILNAAANGTLIIASAGNGGADGKQKNTYPAAFEEYENVLAVAASDRNNERAPFSQSGKFVGIAAPGVDMVSTVPDGGNCVDQGTSFSAPYVAGAAALLKQKHPDWKPQELIWHLEETAERVRAGRDNYIGWGVVDPVAALNDDNKPTGPPQPDKPGNSAASIKVQAVAVPIGETTEDRRARISIYILGGGLLAVGVVVGSAIALRDWRRKTGFSRNGEA
ncbi:type VII secretion-associated serine protease mycosin [Streptomyces sp. NPDC101393]|uniref:type VII secretion-associated serine protease mycosin n=1 Tax=Streptomyces sp. NPDC101393 TaxID=3366141 RepID=UPI00382B4C99